MISDSCKENSHDSLVSSYGGWLQESCVNDPNTKAEMPMTATAVPRDTTSIQVLSPMRPCIATHSLSKTLQFKLVITSSNTEPMP